MTILGFVALDLGNRHRKHGRTEEEEGEFRSREVGSILLSFLFFDTPLHQPRRVYNTPMLVARFLQDGPIVGPTHTMSLTRPIDHDSIGPYTECLNSMLTYTKMLNIAHICSLPQDLESNT